MSGFGRSMLRLRGMLRKEFLQAVRDPSSVAIAFVLPVVLLVLFGYGTSLDLQHAPLALVIDRPSGESAEVEAAFQQSPYFAPRRYESIAAATAALREHRVQGVLWLRDDFGRTLLTAGLARAGLFVNGVDANSAALIGGYVEGALSSWLAARSSQPPSWLFVAQHSLP